MNNDLLPNSEGVLKTKARFEFEKQSSNYFPPIHNNNFHNAHVDQFVPFNILQIEFSKILIEFIPPYEI